MAYQDMAMWSAVCRHIVVHVPLVTGHYIYHPVPVSPQVSLTCETVTTLPFIKRMADTGFQCIVTSAIVAFSTGIDEACQASVYRREGGVRGERGVRG